MDNRERANARERDKKEPNFKHIQRLLSKNILGETNEYKICEIHTHEVVNLLTEARRLCYCFNLQLSLLMDP